MLDQAVFAGGIHGLNDQQDGPLVLGVKFFLQVLQHSHALLQELIGFFFGMDAAEYRRDQNLSAEKNLRA